MWCSTHQLPVLLARRCGSAAAAGVGLGIAKVMSARVAAIGWKVATGTLPPGVAEEQAAG